MLTVLGFVSVSGAISIPNSAVIPFIVALRPVTISADNAIIELTEVICPPVQGNAFTRAHVLESKQGFDT